jgi:hypothetical protein
VSSFLASTLGWTIRKGTRAAAHIPADWQDLCEAAYFRYVHVINRYKIPAELVINMDQQGVLVLIGNNTTYDERGAKQVDIAAKDERRAYTLCVSSTPAGDLLPFQQIWGGQSPKSLPTASVRKSAESKGFHFAFAQSPKKTSHFSTFKTMKEVRVLLPFASSPSR